MRPSPRDQASVSIPDYLEVYHLENYLFTTVANKFVATGNISLIDLYMIIIWKAPRAKSYALDRLRRIGKGEAAEAVSMMATALRDAKEPKNRLKVLMDCFGFRLATATAILTVFYPNEFSVYDRRVCEQLKCFEKLADRGFSEGLWSEYQDFIEAVRSAVPERTTLRDKDQHLWGKSFYEQCKEELGIET